MFRPFTLNLRGKLHEYGRPAVMGIINVTPDSFYASSRAVMAEGVKEKVAEMLDEKVDIIDIGGYSTRPGAHPVSEEEEMRRLATGLEAVRSVSADIPVSVDTFRASVARHAVEELGADIVNDIGGGTLDAAMFDTVASLQVPYILMHMRGNPADMHLHTNYEAHGGVVTEVMVSLAEKIRQLRLMGVADIIADPGLGFAKTLTQNYELLDALPLLADALEVPILAGLSRKSMLTRPLGLMPGDALNATTAANTIALMKGAAVLRVHDVWAARQAVEIASLLPKHPTPTPPPL